jgi:U6 snRNA-associated Sm-like protein LSm8
MVKENEYLKSLIDKVVNILTFDGRSMIGTLKGVDHANNIILGNAHERIFSETEGVEDVSVGLYLIRGDSVIIIGEVDEEADNEIKWDALKGTPLPPIRFGFQ